ncbi:hypothetical protein VTJ04DRAFT_872 [Mycothermus thermophilus]|uniref:uncharacterized protein n=1 Tax=Humicola insolens TaxID=85995 RepID=UPI00374253D7
MLIPAALSTSRYSCLFPSAEAPNRTYYQPSATAAPVLIVASSATSHQWVWQSFQEAPNHDPGPWPVFNTSKPQQTAHLISRV